MDAQLVVHLSEEFRVVGVDDGEDAALEILGAAGLSSTEELAPHHIMRRVNSTYIRSYADIYDYCEPGELLDSRIDKRGGPNRADNSVSPGCFWR